MLALPEQPLAACDGLEGRDLYGAWLGCSQQQDAADCLAALKQAGSSGAQWLVVDHYGLDASWEGAMRESLGSESPPQLLVIDDLADRSHSCDLLLDQNFFGEATERRYQGLVPPQCRQLLGPHYALLGPEYALLHPLVPPRTELRRVLVFFGGVDPDNCTGEAIKALMAPELAHLAVDVVLGLQCPHRQVVETLVAKRPHTTLHGPQPSLAGLIARADLAIGAGGGATWERSCLLLPSVVVSVAENQHPCARAMHIYDQLIWLGNKDECTIQRLKSVILSVQRQQLQHETMRSMTDGLGSVRICDLMLCE